MPQKSAVIEAPRSAPRLARLSLAAIRADAAVRARSKLDPSAIDAYAEAYGSDQEMPPVVVFFDGTSHWL